MKLLVKAVLLLLVCQSPTLKKAQTFDCDYVQLGEDIHGSDSLIAKDVFTKTNGAGNVFVSGYNLIEPGGDIYNPAVVAKAFEFNGVSWVQKGDDIVSLGFNGVNIFDLDISESGDEVIIGRINTSTPPTIELGGIVSTYKFDGEAWVQVGQDFTEGETIGAGVSISGDGNTVAVSNPHSLLGQAYENIKTYQLIDGIWQQIGGTITNTVVGSHSFGSSVELNHDGTVLVKGEKAAYVGGVSSVQVYHMEGDLWVQKGSDILGNDGDTSTGENFGWDVDINGAGDVVAASSFLTYEPDSLGYVRVFEFDGNEWQQMGGDIWSNYDVDSVMFGGSVSINDQGNILAVGAEATSENGLGYVQVFELIDNEWSELNTAIEDINNEFLGNCVSLNSSGNILATSCCSLSGVSGSNGLSKVFHLPCYAGCMIEDACNYDPMANVSDNSCYFIGDFCDDGDDLTENDVIQEDCTCSGVNDVQEVDSNYELQVFPINSDLYRVRVNDQELVGKNLIITNSLGGIVRSITVNQKVIDVDVSSLRSGVYIFSVEGVQAKKLSVIK